MEPEVVDAKLRCFLNCRGLLQESELTCWKIGYSKLSGRGLLATRDIERDELIYVDSAVVLGPRCYSKYLPMCVSCYKSGCVLFPCDRGCGLPVCSDVCQNERRHVEAECTYLRRLETTCGPSWSLELLQAVVPIRALLLANEQKDIFYSLQYHEAPQHGREVEMLKRNIKGVLKTEDEMFMRRVCGVMDTNSFESAAVRDNSSTSLRALFPLGALTNHQCIPNTRHIVDSKGELYVYSTMSITKGEEITMTYTDVLWDTTMRRQFLRATKHFCCCCTRCSDVTECGTLLGALYCAEDQCFGNLLPDDPLSFNSAWTCNECGLVIKNKQISSIRAGIAAAIEEVLYTNPRRILRFIQRELSVLIPARNYVTMEMLFRVVSLFGRVNGFTWQELSDEDLNIKIQFCNTLIECLEKLNCGDYTKKGLILYELYCTKVEKFKRASVGKENLYVPTNHEINPTVNDDILLEAMRILKKDVVAPNDYQKMYAEKSLIAYKEQE